MPDLVPGAAAGHLGGAEAVHALADRVAAGLGGDLRDHLMYFAIRVGVRRLADAAAAERQARMVGSLQYDIVGNERRGAERTAELAG
ncbi:hypothetical protein [Dactylosporangium sp. CA-233914]|uniref:hypothetical protein n=1 Tax=Dactylosporangium sp. CA-233914 TaxID=3239934 RepID=UPI003D8D0872